MQVGEIVPTPCNIDVGGATTAVDPIDYPCHPPSAPQDVARMIVAVDETFGINGLRFGDNVDGSAPGVRLARPGGNREIVACVIPAGLPRKSGRVDSADPCRRPRETFEPPGPGRRVEGYPTLHFP